MLFQSLFAMAPTYAAPITYRSKSSGVSSGLAITKPAGVAVGDVVIVFQPQRGSGQNVSTSGGSAWTSGNFSDGTFSYGFAWKILNATDVANTWSYVSTDWSYVAVAYVGNGATAVSLKETKVNASGGSSLVYAGFNPSASHRGVLAALVDATNDVAVQPTNWALRDSAVYATGPSVRYAVADNLGGYQGGGATWTSLSGASNQTGILLEVT